MLDMGPERCYAYAAPLVRREMAVRSHALILLRRAALRDAFGLQKRLDGALGIAFQCEDARQRNRG